MKDSPKEQNFFREILKASLIALIIVVPVRFFIAQPYIVAGASMDTTFSDGHYIIVDQLTYRFEEPERGDVIVFKYPKDPSKYFIKRIIGLPGESVVIDKGAVLIGKNATSTEGTLLPEPYVDEERKTTESLKRILEDDEYFVLGDNRAASSDSRVWGPLQERFIVGRAVIRILPITGVGLFPGQYTFQSF